MSNFEFLEAEWPEIYASATEAEKNAFSSPLTAGFHSRRAVELAVKWMYAHDPALKLPYKDHLMALIHEPTFKDTLDSRLFAKLRTIIKLGNQAVHSSGGIDNRESAHAVKELYHFCYWLYRTYSRHARTRLPGPFQPELLQPGKEEEITRAEIRRLQKNMQQKETELAEREARLETAAAEIAEKRQEIEAIKTRNRQVPDQHDYSEAETRQFYIDLLLKEAGWDINAENVVEYPVVGMPTEKGEGYADYVLWGDNGLPLAVVEAKRTKVDPLKGRQQAKLYADCLEAMHGQRPVIFYTNGYETHLWDDLYYPPRPVQGFYKKDELQTLINRRNTAKNLSAETVNKNIADRYYQEEAIRRITEDFQKRQRKALIVMATGAGKTRVAIALVELLQKCNWIKRVLFLADRTALVRQAWNAFKQHLPHTPAAALTENREEGDARIVLSTYPTIMNLIDESRGGSKRYSVGHFDLVIIDEAHRSVYQKYRAIFSYFDALLVGLTATPRSDIDRNTYELFELEDRVPTFTYELNQAVKDGFLVPFKAHSVPVKFLREGITYSQLSEEEKEEYEEKLYDEESGVVPERIDKNALYKWLFNKNTVDQVLKHLMEQGLKVHGGDRLGKTIIFAKNHDHAEFIVQRFDKNYPHLAGHFCRVIDNYVNYAQSLIDDFSEAEKNPVIAVSVDMLDTGIDVLEILNLVFFKPVYSRTKFLQMLGRGTRRCENLFGPGQDKREFYVFDYCQNFEFFEEQPDGVDAAPQEPLSQRIFKHRLTLMLQLKNRRDEEEKMLQQEILDMLYEAVTNMNPDNFIVRQHRKLVEQFKYKGAWLRLSQHDIINLEKIISGLPTELKDNDEFAKRFDLLILKTQLALLKNSVEFVRLKQQIITIAGQLEEKSAVPLVQAQLELIGEIQTESFWQNMTLPLLETIRRRLRDLIQLIDRRKRVIVYTNFMDALGEMELVAAKQFGSYGFSNYRDKVRQYIKTHQNHLTIQKLKQNIPITKSDIEELERLLLKSGEVGSKEVFEENFGSLLNLGPFIRQLVGLDQPAAKKAFGEFLNQKTLNATQIRFIDQIIEYLTRNGIMEPKQLYEEPFISLHQDGLDGVFPDTEADQIIRILETINRNAVAA